jgi:hypothetical protein
MCDKVDENITRYQRLDYNLAGIFLGYFSRAPQTLHTGLRVDVRPDLDPLGGTRKAISNRPGSRSARKVPRLRFTEGRSGLVPRFILEI